jgi:hypothetical protein
LEAASEADLGLCFLRGAWCFGGVFSIRRSTSSSEIRCELFAMAEDPFESPKLLLARAQEHIADFKKREKAFFESQPYTQFVDKDAHPGWDTVKLKFTRKVPGIVSTVCADALSNLRHALDHAVCASVFAMTGTMPRGTYFPFGGSADELKLAIKDKCKRVTPEVLDYIRSLNPYRGAKVPSLLWMMSRIAAPNKHRVLSPIITGGGGQVAVHSFKGFGTDGIPSGWWDRDKNELQIALFKSGTKPDYHLQFPLFIAISDDEADITKPVPVAFLLLAMAAYTESAVKGIEAETLKLVSKGGA